MSGIYRRQYSSDEGHVGRPRKLENVLNKFNADVAKHWKAISASLSAQSIDPLAALEQARAANLGAHHDVDMSRAFHQALHKAMNDAASAQNSENSKKKSKPHSNIKG